MRHHFSIIRDRAGFTVIEMLVVIGITSLLGVGVVTAFVLMSNTSSRNSDQTYAVKQLQNAAYWLRVDAKRAQTVQTDVGASGLPLQMSWVEWDNSVHQVVYSVVGDKMQRSYSVDGGQPTVITVADYIDSGVLKTNVSYIGGILTFELTTNVGDGANAISRSAVFRVNPRASN
jgi:prepilin-type N-terminal cleavage/methylation domain-containing protein